MTLRRLAAAAACALAAAMPCHSFAAEPNETFATATLLDPGVLTVADELTPASLEPDTLLGVRNNFGSVYATDDDSSPRGNGLASGLEGVPTNSGSIDFSVTGYTDGGFSGNHDESGAYRVYVDVYDFFDDFLLTLTADRVMQPGVVDDFNYPGDADWIGGSYDVAIDNDFGGVADVDFFTFTGLTPGATFTAETVDPTVPVLDTRLGWFGPAGTLIAFDEDSGAGFLSLLGGVVPANGALTFAVSGTADVDFAGDHGEVGGYELKLTLGGALNADFDNSGGVRAADLALWRSNFAATAVGDADNDNDTDGADFLIWQREFGSGTGPAHPIPEPAALALAVLAAALTTPRLRRRTPTPTDSQQALR